MTWLALAVSVVVSYTAYWYVGWRLRRFQAEGRRLEEEGRRLD